MIPAMVLYVCIWFVLTFIGWSPGLGGGLLLALMGFGGSGFVLTFACAKEVVNPDLSGMGVSVVNTGCFIGTALMQPLFGWMADLTWDGTLVNGARVYSSGDYHNGFLLMLGFAVVGLVGSLCVRETRCRNITV